MGLGLDDLGAKDSWRRQGPPTPVLPVPGLSEPRCLGKTSLESAQGSPGVPPSRAGVS